MTECGHCGDCKWWERDGPDWSWCLLADVMNRVPEHPKTLFYGVADSTGLGSVRTHADFGCVQFAAAPTPSGEEG